MGEPRRVGPYTLEGELGRGGLGVVHRARAPDGSVVALKLLLGADPELVLAFARERRLQGALGAAEGFVPLLDAGQERGQPWLAMPLLEGGTLRDRLRRGPLGVGEAAALARDLARAVGAAHGRGIVHRDLKPENILFDGQGRPFVADLGLAKHYRRDLPGGSQSRALSQSGTVAGTVGYLPLEQALDSTAVGPPADVHALGAILFEALAGQRPFPGTSLVAYARQLELSGPPALASRGVAAPAWLEAVVARALARAPEERFPDGAALAAALDEGLRRAGGRSRRRAAPAAAVAGLVLAVAGGAAAALRSRPSPPSPPSTGPAAPAPATEPPPASTAPVPTAAAEAPPTFVDEFAGADGGWFQEGPTAYAFTPGSSQSTLARRRGAPHEAGRAGVGQELEATGAPVRLRLRFRASSDLDAPHVTHALVLVRDVGSGAGEEPLLRARLADGGTVDTGWLVAEVDLTAALAGRQRFVLWLGLDDEWKSDWHLAVTFDRLEVWGARRPDRAPAPPVAAPAPRDVPPAPGPLLPPPPLVPGGPGPAGPWPPGPAGPGSPGTRPPGARPPRFEEPGAACAPCVDDGAAVADVLARTGLRLARQLGTATWKHAHWVWGVAAAPDGARVASVGNDRTLRVWDVEAAAERHAVEHPHGVSAVRLPTRGLAFTACHDGWVRLVGLPDGERARVLQTYRCPRAPWALAVSPDGRTVVAGGEGGFVRLWPVDRPDQPRDLPGHAATVFGLAFSPDGQELVTADEAGRVLVTHLATGAARRGVTLPGTARAAAWGEDGIVVGGASRDGRGFILRDPASDPVPAHDTRCNGVAARGPLVASVGWDRAVLVQPRGAPARRVAQHVKQSNVVALAAGVDRLVSGGIDHVVKVVDLDPDLLRTRVEGHAGPVAAVTSAGLSLGADGVLRGADGAVVARNLHTLELAALATTASGHTLAIVEDTLLVVQDGRLVPVRAPTLGRRLALSADGDVVAAAGGPSGVAILDLAPGVPGSRRRAPDLPPGAEAVSVAWVRGLLAVGDQLGRIHLTGRARPLVDAPPRAAPALALAAGGDLVVSGAADGRIGAASVEDGGPTWVRLTDGAVLQVAVAPDGKLLAALSRDRAERARVLLFDRRGAQRGTLDLPWRVDQPTAIAWSRPDELVVGTARGVVLRVEVR